MSIGTAIRVTVYRMMRTKGQLLAANSFGTEKCKKVAKILSRMSIFPVDVGSLSPSYLLESPSFADKMMEINLK